MHVSGSPLKFCPGILSMLSAYCVHACEIAWFSMFSILLFFRLVISVLLSTEDGIHELDVSELLY